MLKTLYKISFVKIMTFICAFFLAAGLTAYAQEDGENKKMAFGLGLEFNMDSRENFAGGFSLGFDYNLPISAAKFAAGLNASTSYNFAGIVVIEPAALFRWYFWRGNNYSGWFVQADLGTFIVIEEQGNSILFLGGLRSGYRLLLQAGNLPMYVEPFARGGYPFVFGVGVVAGIRF